MYCIVVSLGQVLPSQLVIDVWEMHILLSKIWSCEGVGFWMVQFNTVAYAYDEAMA
jgi:hypothetical protein